MNLGKWQSKYHEADKENKLLNYRLGVAFWPEVFKFLASAVGVAFAAGFYFEQHFKSAWGSLIASVVVYVIILWIYRKKRDNGPHEKEIARVATTVVSQSSPARNINELILEIEKRFEIALAISTFFPILLGTYFAVAGGASQSQEIAFFFFLPAGFYLFGFVAFQFVKRTDISKRILVSLNRMVLLGVACYILPVIFLVMTANNKTPITWALLTDALFFEVSLWGIIIISGLIALGMFIGFLYWAWSAGSKSQAVE